MMFFRKLQFLEIHKLEKQILIIISTSLLTRFCDYKYIKDEVGTIGMEFKQRQIEISNEIIKMQIWDTTGGQRYKPLKFSPYNRTDGFILAYSIIDSESFQAIEFWMKYIQQFDCPNKVIILVGNKVDQEERRLVDFKDGKTLAEKYSILFFETSAKDNINVSNMFLALAQEIRYKKTGQKTNIPLTEKNCQSIKQCSC